MVVDRLRRDKRKDTSGKYLVSTGLFVLAAGLFTETLAWRVGVAGHQVSILEIGLLILGAALGRLFVRAILRELKRTVLKGLAGRLAKRLPHRGIAEQLPWFGASRYQRLARAVGGKRGIGMGGVSGTLFVYGAEAGKLGETYLAFGHRLELATTFALLAVPGAAIYVVRNV